MNHPFPRDRKLLIGVVHLAPLPGSPGFRGETGEHAHVREAARRDAEALLEGGMDGFIVENFGDAPFHKGGVEPVVVAEMTLITAELARLAGDSRLVGVNVLRNDARAALSVASAAGAAFVRVNVHTGAMLTDQGWIEGRAAETLRLRRQLAAELAIAADVEVKHAIPPAGFRLEKAARETAGRGGADALIVTGAATGEAPALERLETVRRAVPGAYLFAGSGVRADTVADVLAVADGVIVGTSLKEEGDVHRPVCRERVRALVSARGRR